MLISETSHKSRIQTHWTIPYGAISKRECTRKRFGLWSSYSNSLRMGMGTLDQHVIENAVKSVKGLCACVAVNGEHYIRLLCRGNMQLSARERPYRAAEWCCECFTTFAVNAELYCHVNWCSVLQFCCLFLFTWYISVMSCVSKKVTPKFKSL